MNTRSISILHVDDETDFADSAAAFVERANDRIQIETATNADGARSFLSDHDID